MASELATGDTTNDDKYVVVKRNNVVWHAVSPDIGLIHARDILPDATVIRGQDIFASTALFSYANSILATIELLEATGTFPPKHLLTVADFFHQRGLAARGMTAHKIPD